MCRIRVNLGDPGVRCMCKIWVILLIGLRYMSKSRGIRRAIAGRLVGCHRQGLGDISRSRTLHQHMREYHTNTGFKEFLLCESCYALCNIYLVLKCPDGHLRHAVYGLGPYIARVYHGLPKTRGVSETGHTGSGTVLDFGTLQHTVYPCRSVAGIHGYISKVI